jgi:hypothetical protein
VQDLLGAVSRHAQEADGDSVMSALSGIAVALVSGGALSPLSPAVASRVLFGVLHALGKFGRLSARTASAELACVRVLLSGLLVLPAVHRTGPLQTAFVEMVERVLLGVADDAREGAARQVVDSTVSLLASMRASVSSLLVGVVGVAARVGGASVARTVLSSVIHHYRLLMTDGAQRGVTRAGRGGDAAPSSDSTDGHSSTIAMQNEQAASKSRRMIWEAVVSCVSDLACRFHDVCARLRAQARSACVHLHACVRAWLHVWRGCVGACVRGCVRGCVHDCVWRACMAACVACVHAWLHVWRGCVCGCVRGCVRGCVHDCMCGVGAWVRGCVRGCVHGCMCGVRACVRAC